MKRRRDRLIMFTVALLAVLAVLDQIGRRPEDRDWNGRIFGVPYDFRLPTLDRAITRLWNPEDERILVPTVVGLGWTVNLYQLKRRLQLLIA